MKKSLCEKFEKHKLKIINYLPYGLNLEEKHEMGNIQCEEFILYLNDKKPLEKSDSNINDFELKLALNQCLSIDNYEHQFENMDFLSKEITDFLLYEKLPEIRKK